MSNGSDGLVQERPAWLIPAVVAAGVAIFSAAFAYYYFGPTPSELLGLDPRASDSSEKVHMTIGDRQFLIPANFTRYPLQRVGGTQDEIDLHALLPELAPYTEARRQGFEDNTSGSPLIHIKLHLAGNLLPASRRLDDIYSRHLATRTPRPGPSGLEQYGFLETSGYRDQDLFVAEQDGDQPVLILCFHQTNIIFSPNCTRTLHLTNEVALTYRYKRTQLEGWETIDRTLIALIESFVVAPDIEEPIEDEIDSSPAQGGLAGEAVGSEDAAPLTP